MLAKSITIFAALALAASAELTLLKKVRPEYPAVAKEAGISGAVKLRLTITAAGKVDDAIRITRHGHEKLPKRERPRNTSSRAAATSWIGSDVTETRRA